MDADGEPIVGCAWRVPRHHLTENVLQTMCLSCPEHVKVGLLAGGDTEPVQRFWQFVLCSGTEFTRGFVLRQHVKTVNGWQILPLNTHGSGFISIHCDTKKKTLLLQYQNALWFDFALHNACFLGYTQERAAALLFLASLFTC